MVELRAASFNQRFIKVQSNSLRKKKKSIYNSKAYGNIPGNIVSQKMAKLCVQNNVNKCQNIDALKFYLENCSSEKVTTRTPLEISSSCHKMLLLLINFS